MARRLRWSVTAGFLGVLVILFSPPVVADVNPPYSVTAVLGGEEVAVGTGSVIGKGRPVGDDSCLFAKRSEVSFEVPDDQGPFALEIRLHVNDECDLIIQSIEPMANPPTAPPPAEGSVEEEPRGPDGAATDGSGITTLAAVRHYGWARHRVEEYVNIWVTYTYVEMKYTRDGGRVYGGSAGLCRWWNDGAGWTVTGRGCTWNPSGPSSVWIRGGYHFSSWIPPQPEYTLYARFIADPGPRRTCSLSEGVVPLGWDAICTGGIYW
jgi:hypothetical protein